MLQKINRFKRSIAQLQQRGREQFASLKARGLKLWNFTFPKPHKEKKELPLHIVASKSGETWSVRQIALFWIWGLLAVALGYFLYTSMSYVFLLLAALIISLAMEGVVSFRWRLTHNRGVGIAIAYLLLLLFLFSGFIIMVPFFLSRGTQILQSIMTSVQGIQTAILTQGIEGYIRTSSRIPTFFHDDILAYIQTSSSLSLIQTISDNLGQVVNLTSTYLKTIGEYTVNIFGGIFSIAGKMIILFTLSIFFSLSHYEVKYGLKYLLRRVVTSREKIDAVYEGIASRLKSQLLLCVFIGLTTYLGLWILELCHISLPQKGVLALLAGALEIIPYVGPFLGAFPAVIFGLMYHGFGGVLAVIIVYTIIQQFEGNVLIPFVMNKTLGLNPLLVFVCLLFGGVIMGVLGIVLAVPIAVIVSIIFEYSHKEQQKKEEEIGMLPPPSSSSSRSQSQKKGK